MGAAVGPRQRRSLPAVLEYTAVGKLCAVATEEPFIIIIISSSLVLHSTLVLRSGVFLWPRSLTRTLGDRASFVGCVHCQVLLSLPVAGSCFCQGSPGGVSVDCCWLLRDLHPSERCSTFSVFLTSGPGTFLSSPLSTICVSFGTATSIIIILLLSSLVFLKYYYCHHCFFLKYYGRVCSLMCEGEPCQKWGFREGGQE